MVEGGVVELGVVDAGRAAGVVGSIHQGQHLHTHTTPHTLRKYKNNCFHLIQCCEAGLWYRLRLWAFEIPPDPAPRSRLQIFALLASGLKVFVLIRLSCTTLTF